VEKWPSNCHIHDCVYGRKHVPWISFGNVPTSWNLSFKDFPSDYTKLPTVAFVIPNLYHDMHNFPDDPEISIPAGDSWLRYNLDRYYQWARTHNSLLIITFDENDDKMPFGRPTDPQPDPKRNECYQDLESRIARIFSREQTRVLRDCQNQIATIFAGEHVKHGEEHTPMTHVNLLRTIEAIYGLPKSGRQQPNAARFGIPDDRIASGVFEGGSGLGR
jgi:acid phosphatase